MVVIMVMMMFMLIMIVVMMVMMMLVLMFSGFFQKFILQGYRILHHLKKLFTVQLIDGRGDDRSLCIQRTEHFHGLRNLCLVGNIGTAHHDSTGAFHLIIEEFAEVAHVHFAFLSIHNGGIAVEDHFGNVRLNILHRNDNIGELAHAGGLDQDPVRMIGLDHFAKRCAEIAYQRTADAARIHLPDLDA